MMDEKKIINHNYSTKMICLSLVCVMLLNNILIFSFSIDSEDVRLMLWDTAGQEEFDAITKAYYRGK